MKHLASVFDWILIRFLAVAVVIPLLVSNALADYTLTDLGEFGKRSQYNVSINNAGQVVGCVYTPDGGHHAAIWSYGVITDLGTLGGKWSYANGINEAGQVVGVSHIEGDQYFHAFLWSNGAMQDLGAGGGNYGYAHSLTIKVL